MQRISSNTGSSATSYTDTTAEPGAQYRYKVQARNAQGNSPRSGPANITTPTPPAQVQDVSATQEDADDPVAIAWTSLDEATAYQVERRTVTDLSADPVIVDVDRQPPQRREHRLRHGVPLPGAGRQRRRLRRMVRPGPHHDTPGAQHPRSAGPRDTQRGDSRLGRRDLAGPAGR